MGTELKSISNECVDSIETEKEVKLYKFNKTMIDILTIISILTQNDAGVYDGVKYPDNNKNKTLNECLDNLLVKNINSMLRDMLNQNELDLIHNNIECADFKCIGLTPILECIDTLIKLPEFKYEMVLNMYIQIYTYTSQLIK